MVTVLLLASLMATVALTAYAATQITQRETAEVLLTRVVRTLFEIDQYVGQYWSELELLAVQGQPIPLDGFPLDLYLDPQAIADGPESVANAIAVTTASLVYDDGFESLADTPQQFRLISRGAAFDASIGRLTDDGQQIANAALLISAVLALLLLLSVAALSRGLGRFALPTLSVAIAGGIAWIVASWAQSDFERRGNNAVDAFSAELWWIGADAISLLIRDAAIIAIAGLGLLAFIALATALLRVLEAPASR